MRKKIFFVIVFSIVVLIILAISFRFISDELQWRDIQQRLENTSLEIGPYEHAHSSYLEWAAETLERIDEHLMYLLAELPTNADGTLLRINHYHVFKVSIENSREQELFWDTNHSAVYTLYTATVQHVFYEHPLERNITIYNSIPSSGFLSPHNPITAGSEIYIMQRPDTHIEVGHCFIMFLTCRTDFNYRLTRSLNDSEDGQLFQLVYIMDVEG